MPLNYILLGVLFIKAAIVQWSYHIQPFYQFIWCFDCSLTCVDDYINKQDKTLTVWFWLDVLDAYADLAFDLRY